VDFRISDSLEFLIGDTMSVEKVVRKIRVKDQTNDYAFWRKQSYMIRLEALEQLRKEYHQWRYRAEPRLQRVCSIIKRI